VSGHVADLDSPVAGFAVADAVVAELTAFVRHRARLLVEVDPMLDLLAQDAETAVLSGGKRLRPTFAYWGWRSASDRDPAGCGFVGAAASLELLHACALVHDDLMDGSDTRRGQPSSHVRFAQQHDAAAWRGSASDFGTAAALLLGDLLLSWAGEMFTSAIRSLPGVRAAAAATHFDLMRTEVVAGQFLDVLAQTRGGFDPDTALRVIRYKTSKYTVERPLLMGASAAGADSAVLAALSAYGLKVGEAFQLRDDLLGVFGDPELTGKPAGDDLREGKRTFLLAMAMQAASASQQGELRDGVGSADLDVVGVQRLRQIIVDTGAVRVVEDRIASRARQAVASLDGAVSDAAEAALCELADAAAHRTS
jgi:geranylgeranyl diphosphate synthase type I